MSGPYLSSSVADLPLRTATRLSLGGPLPRQQADRPQAPLLAPGLTVPGFNVPVMPPGVPWGITSIFTELFPTKRQIAYVLRTRSPLNINCIATANVPLDLHVLTIPPAFTLNQDQILRKSFKAYEVLEPFLQNQQSSAILFGLVSRLPSGFRDFKCFECPLSLGDFTSK